MKMKLLPKFILSLAVLGIVLTVVISFFSYKNSRTYLEDMYAEHVTVGAKSIASMIPLDDVKTIIAEGGDQTEAYTRTYNLFNQLKKDGEITYLSLTIPDEDSVTFYIDAMVEEMGDLPEYQLPYGSDIPYKDGATQDGKLLEDQYQIYLDVAELYQNNKGTDAPMVVDNAYGYNYTAVAPILDENGKAVAEIQYILDMQEVRDLLNSFLYTILGISFAIIVIALLLYVLFVRQAVVRPVLKLKEGAEVLSGGNLQYRMDIKTGDELEDLSHAFNMMALDLDDYMTNLAKVTAEKERIGAELDVATHIQASMLPSIFPAFPDRDEFDVYATMTPAKEVGGDFYDFFMVDETHIAIVMADVSGKGVPAALFMVIAKTLLKDHTQPDTDLGTIFTNVNNLLCESDSEGLFVTAFEGVLDLVTGEFCFVNAGHETPFICKKDGKYEPYKIRSAFVLSGMENMKYKSGSMMLEPGDKIFQYTDGVTEATDANNQLYGMDRLGECLAANSDKTPNELLPLVKADIDKFVGKAPQFDDITMLCLEYKKKAVAPKSTNESDEVTA